MDQQKSLLDEVASKKYDVADKPFDFVEQGRETALVCETDFAFRTVINKALNEMGYYLTEPVTGVDALKSMRFHVYQLIVVNELFGVEADGENSVLKYLEQLPMSVRRNIFVIMLSNTYRTMDRMAAFVRSVNLIVNVRNIGEIGAIIKRGLAENEEFYRIFKELLFKRGGKG